MNRVYTPIATAEAKRQLNSLFANLNAPELYQKTMVALGNLLAEEISPLLKSKTHTGTLIVSTAEDADFLQYGVSSTLQNQGIDTKLAVFWNHHYQLPNHASVAPILHRFIEPNFEQMHIYEGR